MMQIDSYSAFYDNGHITQTELDSLLKAQNIDTLYVVGLATDFCVYYTAMDARTLGLFLLIHVGNYKTFLLQNVTIDSCWLAGVTVRTLDL